MSIPENAVFSTSAGNGTTGSIDTVFNAIAKFGCGLDRKNCNWGLDADKAEASLKKWAETAEVNSSIDVLGEMVSRIE